MVKSDHGIATFAIAIYAGSIYGYDVKFSIVIAVDESNPSAHRFLNVFFIRSGNMGNQKSSLGGYILKPGNWSRGWDYLSGTSCRVPDQKKYAIDQVRA